MVDRKPRAETNRTSTARPVVWKPPSTLDAPPPPEGYAHRWIRMESGGMDDRKNLSARLREGFELVRAEEYPDREDLPTLQDGKHAGVIAVGGLVLARIPLELVKQRNAYYNRQTNDQLTAVDNDLLREQNPVMPIIKPERQSRVTFGGPRSTE
jgi:hypothetical protein